MKIQTKSSFIRYSCFFLLYGEVCEECNCLYARPATDNLWTNVPTEKRYDIPTAVSINNNVIFSPKEPSKAEVSLFKSLTVIFNLMTKSSQKTKIYWLLYLFPIVHFYGVLSTLASWPNQTLFTIELITFYQNKNNFTLPYSN